MSSAVINRGFPPCVCPRYALRTTEQADVCEDLALMLADTLSAQLSNVGPEDILTNSDLAELQQALNQQVDPSRPGFTQTNQTHI